MRFVLQPFWDHIFFKWWHLKFFIFYRTKYCET